MNNQHHIQQNKFYSISNQGPGRNAWSHQQQQLLDSKGNTNNSKSPMLMANNNVFSIGPYRQRKDASRVSVLERFEIIGYIASGTYGKVYKAKAKSPVAEDSNSSSKNGLINGSMLNLDNNHGNISLKDVDGNVNDNLHINEEVLKDSISPSNNNAPDLGHGNRGSGNSMKLSPKKKGSTRFYAIKKFKTEREGVEQLHYIGISQSACREMSLCRELDNKHLTKLVEIFLEKKSIYMVSEFAEHDLLQIIHFHYHPEKRLIPARMLKSIMWQILDGVSYLHQNWILHRDLKPANIMVTVDGCVKIGDLGLARKFYNMVQTLYTGDKVVVTIWYRAPELLLGARHYSPAIDLWAVGCILAELIGLRPIFKGEEAKMDSKKSVPFQSNQLQRILEVLGTPTQQNWPNIHKYPEYEQLAKFSKYRDNLAVWYQSSGGRDKSALDLLYRLLKYDPITRIDAIHALEHEYFTNNDPPVAENVFEGLNYKYPPRRIHTNDNDIMNLGVKNKNVFNPHNTQQQSVNNGGGANSSIGGLGVNRRILAAAAAAAAAVQGNSGNITSGSSSANGPRRKKKR
ncbi:HHL195Wp [Eremothecium sinecaudum]|uniref:Cyclin-dependent kinase 8 n=1 Tax=Eremothecium sinecaudum TaxID=45286 RepID=A0A120K2T8_9SACH|nr:HHL195Wp [Eremothecium sinecaudum]AMD22575.1 HHL195Wp [Eremothecium sinecaudum]